MASYVKFCPIEFKRKQERREPLTQRDFLITTEPTAAAKQVSVDKNGILSVFNTTSSNPPINKQADKKDQLSNKPLTKEQLLAISIAKKNVELRSKLNETHLLTEAELILLIRSTKWLSQRDPKDFFPNRF